MRRSGKAGQAGGKRKSCGGKTEGEPKPKANRVLVSAFPTFRQGSKRRVRKGGWRAQPKGKSRPEVWHNEGAGVGGGRTLPIFHAFPNVNDRFLCTFYALDAYTISFSALFASALLLSPRFPLPFLCPFPVPPLTPTRVASSLLSRQHNSPQGPRTSKKSPGKLNQKLYSDHIDYRAPGILSRDEDAPLKVCLKWRNGLTVNGKDNSVLANKIFMQLICFISPTNMQSWCVCVGQTE